jgi:cytoskeletal protein CcmA (bactofilin family)
MADQYILEGFGRRQRMAATSAAQGGVVGEGAVLSGKVKGESLSVLGALEGEVHLEGRLTVGPKGRVTARVRASEVLVEGEIDGEVRTAALTLTETAKAKGTFVAKRLIVKEGALVEGNINPSAPAAEATAARPEAPAAAATATAVAPEETGGGGPGGGGPGGPE